MVWLLGGDLGLGGFSLPGLERLGEAWLAIFVLGATRSIPRGRGFHEFKDAVGSKGLEAETAIEASGVGIVAGDCEGYFDAAPLRLIQEPLQDC